MSEEHDPEVPSSPGFVVGAGVLIFAVMFGVSLGWLSARDRFGALAATAIGERGVLASSGVGLAIGVAAAWLGAAASRRWQGLREIEASAHAAVLGVGEVGMLAIVLTGAVAEETLFRLAVQDQFGLLGSVAASVLLNSWLGSARLTPFVLLHALTLGLVVQTGFGLLGSATAHAIMNYLTLRRIQCT